MDTPEITGSPYSKRYPNADKIFSIDYDPQQQEENENNLNEVKQNNRIVITPSGSPYSRRYPLAERFRFRESEFDFRINENDRWTSSSSDEDYNQRNIQDLSLPVEMVRVPSMASLRQRRDPHFQGVRSRRSRRVIHKGGDRNVGFLNIPQRSVRFFKDFVTTLIDEQWRYTLAIFSLSFFALWILFAVLWFLIAYAHGDLNIDKATGERIGGDDKQPCVHGATNFAGFLLLSIETQVSIGYGNKYPSEECPEAIFLMVVQIVIGVAIEGAMVGIVYAKMVRPPKRSADIKFSKKAVVCQRDGKLCLIFRVCDLRHTHIIDTKIQAFWFEERRSPEGEKLRQFQHALRLENNGRLFIIWPITVCHIIDNLSPLYDFSAKDFLEKRFEIVVTITGCSRSTGQMTQARSSFLPKEILWGHRFVNLLSYDSDKGVYKADYDKIDTTEPVDTALCSARRLDEVLSEVSQFLRNDGMTDFYPDHLHQHNPHHDIDINQIGEIVLEPYRFDDSKSNELDINNDDNELKNQKPTL